MARITPKTNWVGSNIPGAPDFNRIENNSEQAFTELDAEVAARIADVNAEESARVAAVAAEALARGNADTTLQNNINAEAAARVAADNAEASARASADGAITNALKTAGGVGSLALLKNETGSNVGFGGDISGNYLRYSTTDGTSSGGNAPGTWRCLGNCPIGKISLFIRTS
jgi:hypothetical protein